MSTRYPIDKEDFETLESMGYSVKALSMYQYRICRGDEEFMDVFPTTRRYCIKREGFYSKGKSYTSLIDLVESELDVFSKSLKK